MDRIKESDLAAPPNSGQRRRSRVSEPAELPSRRTGESKEYEMVEIGNYEAMDGNMKWLKLQMKEIEETRLALLNIEATTIGLFVLSFCTLCFDFLGNKE
ncbi:hypothetical protein HAX54_016894 [Datura stramonium]|uniref:Uncharacterized protein n=1 Tax=Datura stramonium TaxID=4076 RepID=A0ABS8RJ12_DATST|nr:hypothetical protein [Datura stramonium]